MATVTKTNAKKLRQFVGAPYGNVWRDSFVFKTNASGIMPDSDSAAAVANGDKVILGLLPAGLELHGSLAIVSDEFTALTTAKIGFEYADGVDSAEVPQDDDYFHAALATSAAGRTAANNTAVMPVKLPKDALLTLVVGGADHASAGRLDFIVEGIWTGQPSADPS